MDSTPDGWITASILRDIRLTHFPELDRGMSRRQTSERFPVRTSYVSSALTSATSKAQRKSPPLLKVWRAVPGDEDPNRVTKESENGQATFELEPGHYYAEAEGYHGTLIEIDVTEDREIRLQNASAATVPVEVTDAETGEPIEGAEVSGVCSMWYSSGDSYIDSDGTTDENGVVDAQTELTPTDCYTTQSQSR